MKHDYVEKAMERIANMTPEEKDKLILPFVKNATPENPIKKSDFPGITNDLDHPDDSDLKE